MSEDLSQQVQQQVRAAIDEATPLSIHGAGSHAFMLAEFAEQQRLDMTAHRGIIDYQPTELTLKARAGTPLAEIRHELDQQHQRLATEVPEFSAAATLGGALAMGLSGSGRPFLGALRDHVLGARLVNGVGEIIDCGGQVMKNVAGYDISRLLAGSRGTLGPILDVTVKVLPKPETQQTLVFEVDEPEAIETMNRHAGSALPLTAAAYLEGRLHLRLESSESGVQQARETLGGEELADSPGFWSGLTNQGHEFFSAADSLWRAVLPPASRALVLDDGHHSLIDWCGGVRWISAAQLSSAELDQVSRLDGHVERWRGGHSEPASNMSALQKQMHQRLKHAFDPKSVFNPALSRFD